MGVFKQMWLKQRAKKIFSKLTKMLKNLQILNKKIVLTKNGFQTSKNKFKRKKGLQVRWLLLKSKITTFPNSLNS